MVLDLDGFVSHTRWYIGRALAGPWTYRLASHTSRVTCLLKYGWSSTSCNLASVSGRSAITTVLIKKGELIAWKRLHTNLLFAISTWGRSQDKKSKTRVSSSGGKVSMGESIDTVAIFYEMTEIDSASQTKMQTVRAERLFRTVQEYAQDVNAFDNVNCSAGQWRLHWDYRSNLI